LGKKKGTGDGDMETWKWIHVEVYRDGFETAGTIHRYSVRYVDLGVDLPTLWDYG
jgi:hypothetical protein